MSTLVRQCKAFAFWVLIALFAQTVQVHAQTTLAAYAGTYSGTFSGGDSGTFTTVITSNGSMTLTGFSNGDGAALTGSGQISTSGSLQMTVGSISTGSSFTGAINATTGILSGTWSNSAYGVSGNFTGTRTSTPVTTTTTSTTSTTSTTTTSTTATTTSTTLKLKASQTISFVALPAITMGAPAAVAATATSGLAISFASTTPEVCTLDGFTVMPLAVGVCTVAADQAGNADYSAAPQATQSVTVSAYSAMTFSNQTLTFASQLVGGISAPQILTLTNTSGTLINVAYVAAMGDYRVATTCVGALAANTSCTIQVAFVATYPGERNGTIAVKSNESNNLYILPVKGTATYTVLGYPLKLEPGWNLLGNSVNKILSVPRIFGNRDLVSTVWKWDSTNSGWQFYTPSLSPADLRTYVAGKGYAVLTDINPGEGYWVNAIAQTTLPSPTAAAYQRTAEFLASGWNLVATGLDSTPVEFNNNLKALAPAGGMTSLWAWDNRLSKWYFYSPTLDAEGGNTLGAYIANKDYLDFATHNKTLGKGLGFWVNNAATNITPPVVVNGFTAMGLPFGLDNFFKQENVVAQDEQGGDYIDNGDRVIYCNGYSPSGAYVFCTEPGGDGKITVKQIVKDVGDYIYGKVEGSWLGKRVKQIGISLNTGLDKLTNNVNPLTSLVTKAYVAEVETDVLADNIPPDNLPSNQNVFDKSWQGLKTVLGPLASKLGATNPSEDVSYRPDPSTDLADQLIEQIQTMGSGNGQVQISDKRGNTMADVALKKIATNMAAGDTETVTTAEADKAKTASDLLAAIQSQLTVYQGLFMTAKPDAADPALDALFDESFLQNGQSKQTYLANIPTRTEPPVGATIAGELVAAPLGLQANDANHQWFKLWVTQSGGGTGEDWLAIKDGVTGKWLLGGNQLMNLTCVNRPRKFTGLYEIYCFYLNSNGVEVKHGIYELFTSENNQIQERLTYKSGILNGWAEYYGFDSFDYPTVIYNKLSEGNYLNNELTGLWKYYHTDRYNVGIDSLGKLTQEVTYGILFNGATASAIEKDYCPYGPLSTSSLSPQKAGKLASIYTRDMNTGQGSFQYIFRTGCSGPD